MHTVTNSVSNLHMGPPGEEHSHDWIDYIGRMSLRLASETFKGFEGRVAKEHFGLAYLDSGLGQISIRCTVWGWTGWRTRVDRFLIPSGRSVGGFVQCFIAWWYDFIMTGCNIGATNGFPTTCGNWHFKRDSCSKRAEETMVEEFS